MGAVLAAVVGVACGALAAGAVPVPNDLALVPAPAHVRLGTGTFELRDGTAIVADGRARAEATRLAAALAPATGFTFRRARRGHAARAALRLCAPARPTGECRRSIVLRLHRRHGRLPREAYRLVVRPGRVTIDASDAAGLFYGGQTLRQLLPPEIFAAARVDGRAWTAPAVRIRDAPRFAWRGALLDSARYFFPPPVVKRLLDAMAAHKLNRFQWHLTDDQGWRLPIARYPLLTATGGRRAESPTYLLPHGGDLNFIVNPNADGIGRFDGTPYEAAYTADEIHDIVAYAAARHIIVVPEIEMPGHAQAAIAAYPQLGNTVGPVAVRTNYDTSPVILNVEDSTVAFFQQVLLEVIALFPSPWVHLGGDEVPIGQWEASPAARARMAQLGFDDPAQLEGWLMRRMGDFLAAHGRRLVGWDEILSPRLRADTTITAWHGDVVATAAVRSGFDVVMAPYAYTYLDFANDYTLPPDEAALVAAAPFARAAHAFVTTIETAYAFDPIPSGLTRREARHVVGAQASLWSEWIPDEAALQWLAFPRLCALAEVFWTPRRGRDFTDFSTRLVPHRARLEAAGIRPFDLTAAKDDR